MLCSAGACLSARSRAQPPALTPTSHARTPENTCPPLRHAVVCKCDSHAPAWSPSPSRSFCHGRYHGRFSPPANRGSLLQTSALKARWRFEVRFGRKLEMVQLLQEWVRDVGSQAGLTASNTGITTGAVGAPESRLELEVEVEDMAALESFWAAIPIDKHASWVRIVQDMIVDGTPTWEVYRAVPIDLEVPPADTQVLSDSAPMASPSSSLEIVEDGDLADLILNGGDGSDVGAENDSGPRMPDHLRTTDSGLTVVESMSDADEVLGWTPEPPPPSTRGRPIKGSGSSPVQLDWKGEPMDVKPGDKLPRIQ